MLAGGFRGGSLHFSPVMISKCVTPKPARMGSGIRHGRAMATLIFDFAKAVRSPFGPGHRRAG
jgi:hypothetical protein